MAWSTSEFRERYTGLARFYDFWMRLYRVLGMRIGAYRDAAIQSLQLAPGAGFADFELRWPQRWPSWLARLASWLNRPAGVTPDIVDRLPADAIRRHFVDAHYQEFYFGAAYLCAGRVAMPESLHV